MISDKKAAYWKKNLQIVLYCLIVWAAVSLGCSVIFVEQLNTIVIRGLPLGFWFAQQGSIITFIVIIFYYAWRMSKLDKEFGLEEA
jgi:putative solute:sodium symporter small subunit